jgi:hypothetical protein
VLYNEYEPLFCSVIILLFVSLLRGCSLMVSKLLLCLTPNLEFSVHYTVVISGNRGTKEQTTLYGIVSGTQKKAGVLYDQYPLSLVAMWFSKRKKGENVISSGESPGQPQRATAGQVLSRDPVCLTSPISTKSVQVYGNICGDCFMEGPTKKESSSYVGWKNTWFVLTHRHLVYFKTKGHVRQCFERHLLPGSF